MCQPLRNCCPMARQSVIHPAQSARHMGALSQLQAIPSDAPRAPCKRHKRAIGYNTDKMPTDHMDPPQNQDPSQHPWQLWQMSSPRIALSSPVANRHCWTQEIDTHTPGGCASLHMLHASRPLAHQHAGMSVQFIHTASTHSPWNPRQGV
jgi:hypothetical protein